MKYAWASITKSSCNYGNWLIEDSLKNVLDLPDPEIVFDSFRPMSDGLIKELNSTVDMVISPGCTTLQPGQNKAFESFDRLEIPTPSFGGAVWSRGARGRFLAYANMLSPFPKYGAIPSPESLSELEVAELLVVANKHSQPVGGRDPFTSQLLESQKIDSILIGCPTLLSAVAPNAWRPIESKSLIFGFSRNNIFNQISLVNKLSKKWDISLIIHEPYEERFIKYLNVKKVIRYESADQYFDEFSSAAAILTGRLHGALPGIRAGRRVVFFGNPADTRFSILPWLGVKIHRLNNLLLDIDTFEELVDPDSKVFDQVSILRERFKEYAKLYLIDTKI
jgi:hypothetical protein